jgi:heptosyltransferase-1
LRTKKEFFDSSNSILIIKQRGLGDVILSTPTIQTIREYFKHAKIDLVLDSPSSELFSRYPLIDEIIEVKNNPFSILKTIKRIKGGYSLVFDLISTPFSLFLTIISGAKTTIGWAKPGKPRAKFYTHPIDISESIPAIDANLRAVRHLGMKPVSQKVKIYLSENEKIAVFNKFCNQLNLDKDKYTIAIHPGSLFKTKQWFPPRFAELSALLYDKGYQVVLTGSKDEIKTVEKVKSQSQREIPVLPPLSIRDYSSFLASVDLLITNDGGPLHISQAVGTKSFAIFGSTDPYIWFPYAVPDDGDFVYSNIPCSPCSKKTCQSLECLDKIKVITVFKKIVSLIESDLSSKP